MSYSFLKSADNKVITVFGVCPDHELVLAEMAIHGEFIDFCGQVLINCLLVSIEPNTFPNRILALKTHNIEHHLKANLIRILDS